MTRRLTIMPEVLPTPTPSPNGPVRARTLARLKVLTALGAAAVLAGCGKVVDDENGNDGGKGITNGGNDGGPDAYGVVDPLPQPACFENRVVDAVGSYVEDDDAGIDAGADAGGALQIEVDLDWPQSGVVISSVDGDANATFLSSSMSANGAKLFFSIADGTRKSSATVTVSCGAGPSIVDLQINTFSDGVVVTATERY